LGYVGAAVFLPARLVMFGANGLLFAEADGFELVAGNTEAHEKLLSGFGATIT
jgi:hypothetical protein